MNCLSFDKHNFFSLSILIEIINWLGIFENLPVNTVYAVIFSTPVLALFLKCD